MIRTIEGRIQDWRVEVLKDLLYQLKGHFEIYASDFDNPLPRLSLTEDSMVEIVVLDADESMDTRDQAIRVYYGVDDLYRRLRRDFEVRAWEHVELQIIEVLKFIKEKLGRGLHDKHDNQ